mmetsp:Transcript_28753/g.62976  ORF Transcript_28753/g.62976 Transcript_28753/m.62976 type:complete len:326 (+) Transcript_28753:2515-3492(+)
MRFHTGGLCAVRSSCSYAALQTSRHSGSDTSLRARSSAGSRIGTKGSTSYGSSTSFAMFSTMRAQLRLIEVMACGSSPRLSSGAITASADANTSDTKTTPARLCTVSATSSGFRMQSTIWGTNPLMSLLSITPQTSVIAAVAASLTWSLVSHIRLERTGTMSLRRKFICAGKSFARSESSSARSRFDCHLPSASARTKGSTKSTPCGERLLISAFAVASASKDTGLALSAAHSMKEGSIGATYGSKDAAFFKMMWRRAANAPARLFALVFPLSAISAASATKRPSFFAVAPSLTPFANVFPACSRSSGVLAALSGERSKETIVGS